MMVITYILNIVFLMRPIQSFKFNNFKYLMEEIVSSTKIPLTLKHETQWLEQKLDHFDVNNDRKWKMRYFSRRDLWKPSGPIYIFLGGESKAFTGILYGGMAYELAQETNGVLYATEHRYYGKSVPVNGTEVNDLKFLSARQALADNAHLIRTIKLNPVFRKSKVVVIGGSYSGNLAAWMRLLYPDLVDAAIASSAPVLAKKNFHEYLEKVSDDFQQYGTEGCWDNIKDRFEKYDNMFTTKEGIEELKHVENICAENNMSIPENKQLFFSSKVSIYMFIAQYGDISQIKDQCHTLKMIDESLVLDKVHGWNKRKNCYDYDFYKMSENNKNKINAQACWLYQTCSEFGYFLSTSSDKHPFTNNIPVDLDVKACTYAFGPQFNDSRIDREIADVNKMYGGLKPNVTNVVFVNGELDPWSRLGILEDLSHDAPAIIIPRASHCSDLFASHDDDAVELKVTRRNIKHWIKKWIGIQDLAYNY